MYFCYPKTFARQEVLDWLRYQKTFVLLETGRKTSEDYLTYIFTHPVYILCCYSSEEVRESFRQLERFLDAHYYLAGFLSYELGYVFQGIGRIQRCTFPLLWFGVFSSPIIFDHRQNRFLDAKMQSPARVRKKAYQIKNLRLNINKELYLSAIERIKEFLRQGETYEVNYTMKYKFDLNGSVYQLYSDLHNSQSVSYSGFIKAKDFKILTFSPELFFRKRGRRITVRPMKGTTPRAESTRAEEMNKRLLFSDEKNRAENLMIVDLLRNDLGRISEIGSVQVKEMFTVERYETLFQMTSTIEGRLRKDVDFYQIFASLFPSGSVTGAPKIRTMEIIKELERERRQIYTGAIGFIKPCRDAVFNVAIRTILLQKEKGEMGVGSGIVYDSEPEKEYEECRLKADFLSEAGREFQLIETILYSKGRFFLLTLHLQRLRESAEFFDFCYNERWIKEKLYQIRERLRFALSYRVRLLLFKNGDVSITYQPISALGADKERFIALSKERVRSEDIFLYHKTTRRWLYEREYQRYKRLGFYDVIFRNEKDEITEGAISNLFVKLKGRYYTPPLSSGVLNGVYRRYLLGRRKDIQERVLRWEDIEKAEEVYLTNAVRGMVRVRAGRLTEKGGEHRVE
ncbi:MAG: aminodeoxychorismate synthase component I [Candidatus Omnitrophota bacterium]|nr:MAG: aminodeoxychorismate synthase component I [Candidatus Omnitrophota bacterium]